MSEEAPARKKVPVEVVGDELDRLGVRRFDPKSFLLGYTIGRQWPMDDAALRRQVEIMYAKRPPLPPLLDKG